MKEAPEVEQSPLGRCVTLVWPRRRCREIIIKASLVGLESVRRAEIAHLVGIVMPELHGLRKVI